MSDTSSASLSLRNELGLLRGIAEQLAVRPAPSGPITEEMLRVEGFATAIRREQGLAGILRPGYEQFTKLSEIMFCRSRKIERGCAFAKYQDEFFKFLLLNYLGRDPGTIVEADASTVESYLSAWFNGRAATMTVFIPCMISPWPSPRFSVGPIDFIFIDDVAQSEYYSQVNVSWDPALDKLVAEMRKEGAHWLAVVKVEGCDGDRGEEVAELAADLGIVALQISAPYMGTKNMSRLAAHRGPPRKMTLSIADGQVSVGHSMMQPGTSIGQGYLGKIVSDNAPLITAVGNRIQSFTTGSSIIPKLEQAWCDASYWLHEGLAEPLDSIAVAKLETAIEVLLRAESSSGSERRIISAMDTFYSLMPDDPITPHSRVTVKEFARGFVRDRSRVLHGTWSTLNVRLADSRDSLENLALTLVRATARELDLYVHSPSPADETEAFLDWVKARRRQVQAPATP